MKRTFNLNQKIRQQIQSEANDERLAQLCPGCDESGGIVHFLGEIWHPDCAEAFKREYDEIISQIE